MENYAVLSLETHLFFARIMKEHALFLQAGFPCVNEMWIRRADRIRQQFEAFLREVVQISDARVNEPILHSCELATGFTISAEKRTQQLSGIPIDSRITEHTKKLRSGCSVANTTELTRIVNRLNRRALQLLQELITLKENILDEVGKGKLYHASYPLLIQHILREAKLYRTMIEDLMKEDCTSYNKLKQTEEFWNQIMMEHALFIRGMLDPSETELIATANQFANEYEALLEGERAQDWRLMQGITQKSLEETLRYQKFKTAGVEGILNCKIASVILPLLADHVLREANHYIRLLQA